MNGYLKKIVRYTRTNPRTPRPSWGTHAGLLCDRVTVALLATALFVWNSIAWILVSGALARQIFLHARVLLAYYADGHAPHLHRHARRLRRDFVRAAVRDALPGQDGDDAGFISNPHGDAATRRANITATLADIVESLGYNPYFHSMSNREIVKQYPGSRQILDSKDAITYESRADDPYPSNAAHILNDVDYHCTEEQLYNIIDRDEPLFAYSYSPRGAAGTSDGIRYSYNGSTWDFAVPNTPYSHSLWDLEGEARVFTRNSKTALTIAACLAALPVLVWLAVLLFSDDAHSTRRNGVCTTSESMPYPTLDIVWPDLATYDETDNAVVMIARATSWFARSVVAIATTLRPGIAWDETTRIVPCSTWWGFARRLSGALDPTLFLVWASYAALCALAGAFVSGATSLVVRMERVDLKQARCIYAMIPCRRYTPFGTWLLAMSCAANGDVWPAPRRLEPPVSEGYVKMVINQVLQGHDATYVSVKRVDAVIDVRLRIESYNALATTVRNLGKIPGGQTARDAITAEDKLHAPFVMRDDGDSEDVTAHRALLVANAVSAFFTVADYRVSLLHRDGRALLSYTMGADDPDAKDTLRVWSGAVIGDATPHPMTTPVNMRAGVAVRVEAARNTVKPTQKDLDYGAEFVTECVKAVEAKGLMGFKFATVEEVSERQPRPTQQAILREPLVTSLRIDAVCEGLQASVKTKEATKKPRVITTPQSDFSGSRFKLHSSALGYGLGRVFKAFHWSWSGNNHRQVADRIVDMYVDDTNGGPTGGAPPSVAETEVEGDFENMDGSHGLLEYLVFRDFVARVVDPDDLEEAMQILENSFYNKVTGRGVAYDQAWALGSGLWLTTLYNTFTGALIAYRARRMLLGEDPPTAYRRVGGHSGDDSIMRDFPSAKDLEECYLELGYKLKAQVFERGSRKISFLARIYDTRDGTSVPDVARALKKRHTTGLPADVDRKTVAYSKWGPTYIDDHDCGTFGLMAQYVMAETNPDKLGATHEETIQILREEAKAQGWRGRDGAYLMYALLAVDDYARPYTADWAEEYLERDDVLGINGINEIRSHISARGDPYNFPTIRVEAIKPAPIEGGTIAGEAQHFNGVGLPPKKQAAKSLAEASKLPGAPLPGDQLAVIQAQPLHATRCAKAQKAGWGATTVPDLYKTILRHGPLEFARFKNEGADTARYAWSKDQAAAYAKRDRDLVAADWATARQLYPRIKDRVAPKPETGGSAAGANGAVRKGGQTGARNRASAPDRKGKGPAMGPGRA